MVSCILKARLGNQMYIIAAAVSYALKHGMEYHIPIHSTHDGLWPVRFTHLRNTKFNPALPKVQVNDEQHAFVELPFKEEWRDKNIYIGTESIETGYFQCNRYFNEYKESITPLFQIPVTKPTGFVGLHLRRGDYLTFSEEFPPMPITYYEKAISHFRQLGYHHFLVCSDDIKWCRQVFLNYFTGIKFTFSMGKTDKEDMGLLASCDHLIGSNSTFSTWAYILNNNPDKIGIFPNVWFGPKNKHLDSKDIYPEGVIKMDIV